MVFCLGRGGLQGSGHDRWAGKTTIVKAILRILAAKGTSLLLCGPAGRAAKRMSEATGFEGKTIHRLLEVDSKTGGFKRGDDNPLDCDLLLVDETSMVDVMLMQALPKALPNPAALLMVGDIDQLPSVGPGQADVISSGAVPVVRLTEVFRQAAPWNFHYPKPDREEHETSLRRRLRDVMCVD